MVYLTFLFDLLTVLVRFFNWLHSVGDEVTGMVLDMEVVKMADIVLDIEDDKMADMAVDMGVDMAEMVVVFISVGHTACALQWREKRSQAGPKGPKL